MKRASSITRAQRVHPIAGARALTLCALLFGLAAALVGCDPAPPAAPPAAIAPSLDPALLDPAALKVAVPQDTGPFGPTLTRVRGAEALGGDVGGDVNALLSPDTCAPCHAEEVAEWRGSAHALSSFTNPLYRVAFEAFAEEKGRALTPFCGGCHDPALLFAGALTEPIRPEDPRAHAGLGCALCHGAVQASPEGNGSYVWSEEPIPLPDDIPRPTAGADPTLAAHRARVGMAKAMGDVLCQSCHRGFLGPHTEHPTLLTGLDEGGPWRRSPYGRTAATRVDPEPPKAQGCIDCHMPEGAGHRFPGGHTTLAAIAGDDAQAAAIAARLEGAAGLYIVPIALKGDGAQALGELPAGAPLAFDVVIVNRAVGHAFPGGARDLRDTFLEVEVRGGDGRLLAQAGAAYAEGDPDPSAHRLGALVAEEAGAGQMTHAVGIFRTKVFDHTLGPRDAAAVRFTAGEGLTLPPGPYAITARLRHRRLTPSFYASSCAMAETPEGAAFLKEGAALRGAPLEACPPQPLLTLAEASIPWTPGPLSWGDAPPWRVYYHHAQALSHQLQERLGEARHSIALAQAALAASGDASPLKAAGLLSLEAQIAGAQGQTDFALERLTEARRIIPPHAGLDNLEGQALARVWRWPDAQAAFAAGSALAPRHDGLWRSLAGAAGSAGDRVAALEAAQAGLALEPRDGDLLRSQMLALEQRAPGSAEAKLARELYLRYRVDDLAPEVRGRCSDASPDCLRERLPVHVHGLRAPLGGDSGE